MNNEAHIQEIIMLPVTMSIPYPACRTSADRTAEYTAAYDRDVQSKTMGLLVQLNIRNMPLVGKT